MTSKVCMSNTHGYIGSVKYIAPIQPQKEGNILRTFYPKYIFNKQFYNITLHNIEYCFGSLLWFLTDSVQMLLAQPLPGSFFFLNSCSFTSLPMERRVYAFFLLLSVSNVSNCPLSLPLAPRPRPLAPPRPPHPQPAPLCSPPCPAASARGS